MIVEKLKNVPVKLKKRNIPKFILRPVPLFLYQPALKRIAHHIAGKYPEVFSRLGNVSNKKFMINPTNMPFVLLLEPNPNRLRLRAYRNTDALKYDAGITGSLLTLLNMVDGKIDGDAIFFTRNLKIEGNTEAVVTLRNALDNLDCSIADEIANIYGKAGVFLLRQLRNIKIEKD